MSTRIEEASALIDTWRREGSSGQDFYSLACHIVRVVNEVERTSRQRTLTEAREIVARASSTQEAL